MITLAKDNNNNVFVAYTLCERISETDPKDMALESNGLVWKAKGRDGVYLACENLSYAADKIRYIDIFEGVDEINSDSILNIVIPQMKDVLASADLLDEDGYWDNMLYIINGQDIYCISGCFGLADCIDEDSQVFGRSIMLGALHATKGKDVRLRLVEGFRLVDKMLTNNSLPVVITDTSTGEREVVYNYDDYLKEHALI